MSDEWCVDCPECYDRDAHRVNAPCGKVHDCAECASDRTLGLEGDQ